MHTSQPHPRPAVLVVDDDPGVCEALAWGLADAYLVHTATTGAEARRLLTEQRVACISLDALLGREHGLDLLPALRALCFAPVLLLTGHSSEELAIRAVRVGVDEYLKKPPDLAVLHATVARLIARRPLEPNPVAHATVLLRAQLAQGVAPSAIAAQVGMSERHLRRLFHQVHGQTPREYLAATRLVEAVGRLRAGQENITAISRGLGYETRRTFTRVFRRVFGVPPSSFRP